MSPKRHDHNRFSVSVVVVTKDRQHLLSRCLASLTKQSVKPLEVIIVDGSKNPRQTKEAIHPWMSRLPIAVLSETKRSIPYARDLGAKKSRGDIVVYLDDDLAANRHYLKKMREHFIDNPRLTAVVGRIQNAAPQNIYAAVQYAYYNHGLRQQFRPMQAHQLKSGRMLDCEVTGFKRTKLSHYGFGYPRPTHFRNDDVELGLRLTQSGETVIFDPAIAALAIPRTTLASLLATAFWNGYSDAYTTRHMRVDLHAAPYHIPFPLWFWREIRSNSRFTPFEKIWYAIALIAFPAVSRLGMTWYYLTDII